MRLSFALILIFLALSGTSQSAQEPGGQFPDKYKNPAIIQKTESQNQPQAGTPTAFEKSLIESLRAIGDQEKAARDQSRADQKPWWIDYALLAAAVVYTAFAGLQWAAIRRQAAIAEQTITHIERVERPWIMVNVDDWQLPAAETFANVGFGAPLKWSAKNVGKNPAFLTRLVVASDIVPYPIPNRRPSYPESEPFSNFAIPPMGTHRSQIDVVVDAGRLRDMYSGKLCQIFYGIIDYNDAAGITYRTRFCCYWRCKNDKWVFEPVGPPDWIEYT